MLVVFVNMEALKFELKKGDIKIGGTELKLVERYLIKNSTQTEKNRT